MAALVRPRVMDGCLLIAATLVMGTTVNGASRWLVLGPLQMQPSELVKPFVVLQAANLFAPWSRMSLDQKLLWLGSFGGLLLLILKQPNLSTVALMGLTLWMVALAAGLRWRSLLGTALAGSLLGTASILINEYQRIRVVSFPVSYTHLRAHETTLHLVCRLLLEKKKKKLFVW